MARSDRLGSIGIWSSGWSAAFRSDDPELTAAAGDAAAEVEALGFGTLWLGGSPSVDFAGRVLDATGRMTVATGIVSIWQHEAVDVAAQRAELERRHPGRFLLGLGVGHSELAAQYARPYSAMRDYLDALDSAAEPVPVSQRILAALGPKMLGLARERSLGAHPYLVTVEQVAEARALLGPEPLLAPEFKVVLDTDLERARATARGYLSTYLAMANYQASLVRMGCTADDLAHGGSNSLLDALFALGGTDSVGDRVAALFAAGADHVAIQVVTDKPRHELPRTQWRQLAETLPL